MNKDICHYEKKENELIVYYYSGLIEKIPYSVENEMELLKALKEYYYNSKKKRKEIDKIIYFLKNKYIMNYEAQKYNGEDFIKYEELDKYTLTELKETVENILYGYKDSLYIFETRNGEIKK